VRLWGARFPSFPAPLTLPVDIWGLEVEEKLKRKKNCLFKLVYLHGLRFPSWGYFLETVLKSVSCPALLFRVT
jgi:hypothetical protein